MSKSAKSTQFPWLNTPLGPFKSPDSVGFSPLGTTTSARHAQRAGPVPRGPCRISAPGAPKFVQISLDLPLLVHIFCV